MFSKKVSKKIGTRGPSLRIPIVIFKKYCAINLGHDASESKLMKYHATCFPGLEKHLKQELEQIKEIHSIQETSAGIDTICRTY